MRYDPTKIEKKWQKFWQDNKTFEAKNFSEKPKKYILAEFPYPSAAGLHMGHLRSYVAADVVSRYWRARGNEVMFPIGWDAFGLPAENYAIKNKVTPQVATATNIQNFREQINALGLSFDWSREINTTDPEYYKWTQWIFLQLYKAGLAYEATGLINWCPKDKTGLANEEVIDGKCERCGTPVEKKELRQWYLRITAYAEKLLAGLKNLPGWPEAVKLQQENWIGKSTGAEIEFEVDFASSPEKVTVFTTRPDTLYGATYLVLAPEHPLLEKYQGAIQGWAEVHKYIEAARSKNDIQRFAAEKDKTGVELKGVFAVNPATTEKMPVWVADYVMASYGTGAIMAVPAHDQRDKEFAGKFKLPIREAVDPEGKLVNSGEFTGSFAAAARSPMAEKFGREEVYYKMRDWVFSRQRYWGEPIPIIHCDKCGIVAVPEADLPVVLPKVKKYEPTGTGESPLAAIAKWVKVKCPQCGADARRETNTMPQWAGSSWYYLRYADPHNDKALASQQALKYWLPVDIYFGGMEHNTLHLLYSRFWNLFLYDQGIVPVSEPYTVRIPHGITLATDGEKMSKSRGNVVSPDSLLKEYGADTLRMYEMFIGPHQQAVAWNDSGNIGVFRFLQRTWLFVNKNIQVASDNPVPKKNSQQAEIEINRLIKRVTENLEQKHFNTAITAFMEFLNTVESQEVSVNLLKNFCITLAPFAPHFAEELWQHLGGTQSISQEAWPEFDAQQAIGVKVTVVVQVNGRFRANMEIARGIAQPDIEKAALELPTVKAAIGGTKIKNVIFVPERLINFVL